MRDYYLFINWMAHTTRQSLSVFRFLGLLCSFLQLFTVVVVLRSALLARGRWYIKDRCLLILLLELLFHYFLVPTTCVQTSSSTCLGWANVGWLTARLLFLCFTFFVVISIIHLITSAVTNSTKALVVVARCWPTLTITTIVTINLLELRAEALLCLWRWE